MTKGSCVWPAADIPANAHRTRGSGLLLQPEINQDTNKVKGRGELYKTGDWRRHTVRLVSDGLNKPTASHPVHLFSWRLSRDTGSILQNISHKSGFLKLHLMKPKGSAK